MRETTPDASLYGGKPVQERNWGQEDLNPELRDNTPEWKPPGSDISAADAMRCAFAHTYLPHFHYPLVYSI